MRFSGQKVIGDKSQITRIVMSQKEYGLAGKKSNINLNSCKILAKLRNKRRKT